MRPRARKAARPIMNAAGPLVRVKAAPMARAETATRARAPAIAFFAVFILFPRFAGPRSYFSRFAGSGRAVFGLLVYETIWKQNERKNYF